MRCKTCHYSLTGLTEHRCPECGTAFDPNDPTTFDRHDPTRFFVWVVARCGVTFVVAFVLILIITSLSSYFVRPSFVELLGLAGLMTFFATPVFILLGVSEQRRQVTSQNDK